jgi:hypothetical protein
VLAADDIWLKCVIHPCYPKEGKRTASPNPPMSQ